jgi:hypothetical protein
LDAVTFRRCDSAVMAEPATPKIFIRDGMVSLTSLQCELVSCARRAGALCAIVVLHP